MPDRNDAPQTRASRLRAAFGAAWPWVVAGCGAIVLVVLAIGVARSGRRGALPLEEARRAEREENVARMIGALAEVSSAEVLLRDAAGSTPAGASVTLKMRRGSELSDDTAATVAALVASAVPGLDPSNVTVVDASAPSRPRGRMRGGDLADEGASLLRLRREVELALAARLRAFFAAMQIECAVAVSAELDMDKIHERVLELDPKGRGEVVMREERTRDILPPAGPERPHSSAGASANRPAEIPVQRGAEAERSETRRTETAVSYMTREIARSPRGIADVRASVVLFDRLVETPDGRLRYDRTVVPEKVRLGEYARLAARALGLDDPSAVEVQYLPSPRSEPPAAERPALPAGAAYAVLAAIAAAAVAFGVGLARVRARRAGARVPPPEAAPAPAPPVDVRSEVRRLVAEDPDRAAAILGRWIAREG